MTQDIKWLNLCHFSDNLPGEHKITQSIKMQARHTLYASIMQDDICTTEPMEIDQTQEQLMENNKENNFPQVIIHIFGVPAVRMNINKE